MLYYDILSHFGGLTLLFSSGYIGEKMRQDLSMRPGSVLSYKIGQILSSIGAIVFFVAAVYSFWIFDWWIAGGSIIAAMIFGAPFVVHLSSEKYAPLLALLGPIIGIHLVYIAFSI